MTTTQIINRLKLMVEPGQERNNTALKDAIVILEKWDTTNVCRVCGRKICEDKAEIASSDTNGSTRRYR